MTIWIDCLRHGDAVGGQKYRGITDDPLSDKGWQAMQAMTEGKSWQQIISSPLQRCAAFSHDYAQTSSTPLQLNCAFEEYNFGDWEGLTINEIEQKGQQDLLHAFWDNPYNNPPPNAEIITSFNHRVQQGWQALLATNTSKQQATTQDQHLLLITHAGVIRALASYILAIPITHQMRIAIPLASMTSFRIDHYQQEQHVCLNYLGLT
jgi:broad specificity phosphatase PhoE